MQNIYGNYFKSWTFKNDWQQTRKYTINYMTGNDKHKISPKNSNNYLVYFNFISWLCIFEFESQLPYWKPKIKENVERPFYK